jgi:hypothetical protein
MPGQQYPNLGLFWLGWLQSGFSRSEELQALLARHNVHFERDEFESDNTPQDATALELNSVSAEHTLYPSGDQDWFRIPLIARHRYAIQCIRTGDGFLGQLALYRSSRVSVVGAGKSDYQTRGITLDVIPDSTDEYSLRCKAGLSVPGVFGSYRLRISEMTQPPPFAIWPTGSFFSADTSDLYMFQAGPDGLVYDSWTVKEQRQGVRVRTSFQMVQCSPNRTPRAITAIRTFHSPRVLLPEASGSILVLTDRNVRRSPLDTLTSSADRNGSIMVDTSAALLRIYPDGSWKILHQFEAEDGLGAFDFLTTDPAGTIFGITLSGSLFRIKGGIFDRLAFVLPPRTSLLSLQALATDQVSWIKNTQDGRSVRCLLQSGNPAQLDSLDLGSVISQVYPGASHSVFAVVDSGGASRSRFVLVKIDSAGAIRRIKDFTSGDRAYLQCLLETSTGKLFLAFNDNAERFVVLDTYGNQLTLHGGDVRSFGAGFPTNLPYSMAEGKNGELLLINPYSRNPVEVIELAGGGLPVSVGLPTAQALPGGVDLRWTSIYPSNCYFEVFRSAASGDTTWKSMGAQHGDASEEMRLFDRTADPSTTYRYRVGMRLSPGDAWNYSNVRTVTTLAPRIYMALPAPNPMRTTTRIDFEVPARGEVRLDVFNVAGQRVATLVNQVMSAGNGSATWNGLGDGGRTLADGMYFARLVLGGQSSARKILLLK